MPYRTRATSLFLVALVLVLAPALCHAQAGCTDSPENPTALLAVVGAAGAAFPMLRNRLRSRK